MQNNITLSVDYKIPIPIQHGKQRLVITLLTNEENIVQVYQSIDEERAKFNSQFTIINLKLNQTNQYQFNDEVFQINIIDEQYLSFLAYEKDHLMFLNYRNGEFNNKYKGYQYQLLFHPQVDLQIKEYRDLYFNQALSYCINNNAYVALLCDFRVTNKKEVLVTILKNNQILQIYSFFKDNGRLGKMMLFCLDQNFIVAQSIVEAQQLNFIILNEEGFKEYTLKLQINEDTSIVKIFYKKGYIIFLLNENNFGNPWVVIVDSNTLILKKCIELTLKIDDNQFAVILDAFLLNCQQLFIYYEMNIEGMYNEQFLQAVDFTEDFQKFIIKDYIRYPETSVSNIVASDCGFVTIPRAVEIGIIQDNYLEFDVSPISIQKGDTIEQKIIKLNQESHLVYYNRLPNILCHAYHFMEKRGLFTYNSENDFQYIAEEIIKKIISQKKMNQIQIE
ncbi:unnamed protein product [Paramecium pentaurelia]|uniref:Uncharacterized protein n=1 Tax=Paramecium pentaurelia TaxID=43138 RepID=A0A8S1V4I3_9CILI|nr:unnamed protein product [Paramecium pentaurelia]